MPIMIELKKHSNLVLSTFTKKIDGKELYYTYLKAINDGKWKPYCNQVIDLINPDLSEIVEDDIESMIELFRKHSINCKKKTKIAFITSQQFNTDLMKIYKIFFNTNKRKTRVFEKMSDAISWINNY